MNGLEKVVDLLAAVFLLFLAPLLYYGRGTAVSQTMLVGQAGENFLQRISTAGEITLPVWQEFENAMERYGCDKYEFQRERSLYEPVQGQSGVAERIYTEKKESLKRQVWEEGIYRLQKGDRIRLILYVNEIPAVYFGRVRTGATDG